MLGRKDYTQEELDSAKTAVARQLAAYKKLVKAADASADPKVASALAAFEPLFVDNMILALDRRFVHRVRAVAGKEGTPINETELLVESLMNNDGVLQGSTVLKYVPEQSVLKLGVSDRIKLSAAQFERLAKAFLDEIEAKFR